MITAIRLYFEMQQHIGTDESIDINFSVSGGIVSFSQVLKYLKRKKLSLAEVRDIVFHDDFEKMSNVEVCRQDPAETLTILNMTLGRQSRRITDISTLDSLDEYSSEYLLPLQIEAPPV